VATEILRALEDSARRHGKVRVVLETGVPQPEAIALYRKLGYVPIQDYGRYKGAPQVRSFGRDLV
jgi:GNAT superfamily N-acetyltransferase